MKKSILIWALSFSIISTTLHAGGKSIVPAVAPVIPIEEVDISPWYVGAGLVWTKFSLDDCGGAPGCTYEDVTYGAMVRGGYDVNENFGIEARYMNTFLEEGPFGGAPLMHVGIFAKPQYPISERVNLYGLLGYGYTKNLGNGARLDYFDDAWGFSAGAGIEYDLSDRQGDHDAYDLNENEALNLDRPFDGYADHGKGWSLFLDYQRLLIKSDVPDLDAISLGLRYDF